VVTSGRFTDEAIDFASGRNVRLVDGPKLHGLLAQAKSAMRSSEEPVDQSAAPSQTASPEAMSCPTCSKPMVRRTAKRGANAGSDFWGCTGYPSCRATRPIG
jgi:restriction system protein